MRTIKLHHTHEYVTTKVNTANVRSTVLTVTPPNGVFLVLPRVLQAVIKLLKSGGTQLSAGTKVYIGKKRPGDSSPTFLPGVFTLQSFYDLSTAQQRSADNRATLAQDLGAGVGLREQESLIVEIDSPDVLSWSESGTAFEFPAGWAAL